MKRAVTGIEERLRAYIAPRRPETAAQAEAFERAIEAQTAYEEARGAAGIPEGVKAFAIGDFSATLADGGQGAGYTRQTLSPVAWSILENAGLLVRAWPTARRV